jgi:PAS domain S-box-containing protein
MNRASLPAVSVSSLDRLHALQAVVDGSTEYAIIGLDDSGAVSLWNRGAEIWYGLPAAEVEGKRTHKDLPLGEEALQTARAKGSWSGVQEQLRGDGSTFTAALILTKGEAGYTLLARDLGEVHRTMRGLRDQKRELLAFNLDARLVTDTSGTILDSNLHANLLIGYGPEEVLGKPLSSVLEGDAAKLVRETLAHEQVLDREFTVRTRDKRRISVSISGTCAGDETPFLLFVLRDISERKRLAAAADTLELLDAAVLVHGLDGRVTYWSSGAEQLYGISRDFALGRLVHDLLDAQFPQPLAEVREICIATGHWSGTVRYHRATGELTVASRWSLQRDGLGNALAIVECNTDITDRKRLEDQLVRTNGELHRRAEQASESNRLKSEFLANLSHELRTPLNGIIGFAELMHDGRVGEMSPEHLEYTGDILDSGRHLLRLINDLLDLAKIEAGKMSFQVEDVDLGTLLRGGCEMQRLALAKKEIALEVSTDPAIGVVLLDPHRVQQVLFNYLSNALKFTPKGGRIRVCARMAGHERFVLEVTDSGIGISEADQKRLFQDFQQLDSGTARKFQGTGLGLALTRKLVQAQGGSVGLRSEPGKGSTFFASLPLRRALPQEKAPVSATGRRVLVIEDDARDRAWIQRFDAVALDVLLPDRSGWEVLRDLRGAGPNAATPVLALTALAPPVEAEADLDGYLVKGGSGEQVLAALQQVLSSKR